MSDGVAESTENTNPRDPSKGSKKDVWEVVESVSRIFATLAIPVILAVGGWVIQGTVSQQTVSKDYVSLATSILQKKREQDDDESAKGLRKWAVDLLNRTSPVQLDGETAQRLINGTVTIPFQQPYKPVKSFLNPVHPSTSAPAFIEAPATDKVSLTLSLDGVLPGASTKIARAQAMVFHTVGDTGGAHGTETQEKLAAVMEKQIKDARANKQPAEEPLFFYHLGSVVFYNGESTGYPAQFYQPYQNYSAPILAIAGNHDGDNRARAGDVPHNEPTLFGFLKSFCANSREVVLERRTTMNEPYIYWTLDASLATIIGLYSNVGGSLDSPGKDQQQRWLVQQLKDAPTDRALIIAVHHPPYSLDSNGGYGEVGDALDRAFDAAGRTPDLVLSSLSHNYQRFTRRVGNKQLTYLIAGAGGYANSARFMRRIVTDPDTGEKITTPVQTTISDVTLAAYNDTEPGFLRIKVTKDAIKGDYYTIDFQGNEQGIRDSFTVSLLR